MTILNILEDMKVFHNESHLIDRLLSSEAKVDLLILFHTSPQIVDTIGGVARKVGRTPSEIADEVNDLIDLGILSKEKLGPIEVIRLDRKKDGEIQGIISNQLKKNSD